MSNPHSSRDQNINAEVDSPAEAEDAPNPYQPTRAHNEIARPMVRRFMGWAIVPAVIACGYGVYDSWSPLQFAGVIAVGIPLTLLALVINEKERIKQQASEQGPLE